MTVSSIRARLIADRYSRLPKTKQRRIFVAVFRICVERGRTPGASLRALAEAFDPTAVRRARAYWAARKGAAKRVGPETDAEIAGLYRDLRSLAAKSPSSDVEREYHATLTRLRALQDDEARRMRESFDAHRILDPEQAEESLRRADELIRRHEDSSGGHEASGRAD